METPTTISAIVGVASLVVGVVQIVLTLVDKQKGKKKIAVKLPTSGDFY